MRGQEIRERVRDRNARPRFITTVAVITFPGISLAVAPWKLLESLEEL